MRTITQSLTTHSQKIAGQAEQILQKTEGLLGSIDIAKSYGTGASLMEFLTEVENSGERFKETLCTEFEKLAITDIPLCSQNLNEGNLILQEESLAHSEQQFVLDWFLHQVKLHTIGLNKFVRNGLLPAAIQQLVEERIANLKVLVAPIDSVKMSA